jgi:hypothetical protein
VQTNTTEKGGSESGKFELLAVVGPVLILHSVELEGCVQPGTL